MRYSLQTTGNINVEKGNHTLFVIVESEDMVQSCLYTTEAADTDVPWRVMVPKALTSKNLFPSMEYRLSARHKREP